MSREHGFSLDVGIAQFEFNTANRTLKLGLGNSDSFLSAPNPGIDGGKEDVRTLKTTGKLKL